MKKKLFVGLIALFMTFGLTSCASDGKTPYIGDNGNWWIGETDTGVPATGPAGQDGKDGEDGKDGSDGKSVTVVSVEKTSSEGLVDTYTITFSDGTTTTFTVTNGAKGETGAQGPQGIPGDDYVITQADYEAIASIVRQDFVTLTQAQYDALQTIDPDKFYYIIES